MCVIRGALVGNYYYKIIIFFCKILFNVIIKKILHKKCKVIVAKYKHIFILFIRFFLYNY